ncbi:MAG: TadE/TadG family type IV pilus assembly protein [Bradyrhizobium sp.]
MKRRMKAWRRIWRLAVLLKGDRSGIAAVEFAVIAPMMLVLFFGVVEITNGIAAYRDVSIMAHTLSDLTSQSETVQDSDLTNFFNASTGVMYPYVTSTSDPNLKQSIAELWVNSSLQARVQWAVNSDGSTPTAPGTVVTVPSALQVKNTYVIYSSVSYLYKPTGGIGYVMDKAGVNLSDFSYTRPRQSQCVYHYDAANSPPNPFPTPPPACPTY